MNLPDFLTEGTYGEIRLTGHRIDLYHVVDLHKDGFTPEMLHEEFPTLSLALIYKVLAFYLENQTEVGAYVAKVDAEIEKQRAAAPKGPSLAELQRRMRARQQAEKQ